MTENLYLGSVITKGANTSIDPLFMPITDRSITIRPAEPEAKNLKYYMDLMKSYFVVLERIEKEQKSVVNYWIRKIEKLQQWLIFNIFK